MARGAGGGPKTRQGKSASSRNATKHGILSPHPVIIEVTETETDWETHLEGFIASLAPEGKLEEELVQRLAFIFWRMHRLRDYETAQVNYQVYHTEEDLFTAEAYISGRGAEVPDPDPQKVAGGQRLRVVPAGSALDKVIRYEAHLHRLSVQTLHELEALQARRRGERPHLARLDISAPPLSS